MLKTPPREQEPKKGIIKVENPFRTSHLFHTLRGGVLEANSEQFQREIYPPFRNRYQYYWYIQEISKRLRVSISRFFPCEIIRTVPFIPCEQ